MNDERVLFVDDDEMVLNCFGRVLARRIRLDCALGPVQAVQFLADQGPYAVVVTDMRMPGLSGVELLEKIKTLSPSTVGILLTGNASLDDEENESTTGLAFRIVAKPCPAGELLQVIEEAMAQYRENKREALQ